jgi:hypothetical protein
MSGNGTNPSKYMKEQKYILGPRLGSPRTPSFAKQWGAFCGTPAVERKVGNRPVLRASAGQFSIPPQCHTSLLNSLLEKGDVEA